MKIDDILRVAYNKSLKNPGPSMTHADRDEEDIKQWICTHRCQCFTMNPYHLNVLFALIHGYTDPLRFMRLKFNYDLFRVKNKLNRITFNEDIYIFMLETPFALI